MLKMHKGHINPTTRLMEVDRKMVYGQRKG